MSPVIKGPNKLLLSVTNPSRASDHDCRRITVWLRGRGVAFLSFPVTDNTCLLAVSENCFTSLMVVPTYTGLTSTDGHGKGLSSPFMNNDSATLRFQVKFLVKYSTFIQLIVWPVSIACSLILAP
jgi:hypothetical protein